MSSSTTRRDDRRDRPGSGAFPPGSPALGSRRLGMLLVGLLILLVLVGTRTVYLQSVKNRTLTRYAKGQREYTQPLPAVRGDILDRNGKEFAVGEEAVTFYATPKLLDDNRVGTALQISKLLELSRADEEQLVDRLANASGGFVYVARQVPRDKAARLQRAKIPGVGSYEEERRMYPGGPVAGQLIGRVDIDNKGLEGLEALYDTSLTGQPGQQVAVVDPTGVPIDVLELKRERDGRDVQLTIDYVIQEQAERELARTVKRFGAASATAIVMNPRTGEILAMAGVPRVNPEHWSRASALAKRNRAITDGYEPGSTFKVVTISAGLEEGVVTPSTRMVLKPQLTFCDDKKTCTVGESHTRGTETFNTKRILVESSNIGTITIAQKIAAKARAEGKDGRAAVNGWIERFGFGKATGIDFPGEINGLMLPYQDWSEVSIGNIPIGQGITVTPIQLATAYSAIANDGVIVQPHLLERIGNETPTAYPSRRVLSQKTARQMQSMFSGVVEDEHGTGRAAQIPGYKVGGKTGTANVANPAGGYYSDRYISSFVGFVPADNPQLVTLVVVDDPKYGHYGGDVAAPAFESITEFALGYLNIPADGVM